MHYTQQPLSSKEGSQKKNFTVLSLISIYFRYTSSLFRSLELALSFSTALQLTLVSLLISCIIAIALILPSFRLNRDCTTFFPTESYWFTLFPAARLLVDI
jgi:hypothetical protein